MTLIISAAALILLIVFFIRTRQKKGSGEGNEKSDQLETFLRRAQKLSAEGDFSLALNQIEKALQISPKDTQLKNYKLKLESILHNTNFDGDPGIDKAISMQEIEHALKKNYYHSAIEKLELLHHKYPNDQRLHSLLEDTKELLKSKGQV